MSSAVEFEENQHDLFEINENGSPIHCVYIHNDDAPICVQSEDEDNEYVVQNESIYEQGFSNLQDKYVIVDDDEEETACEDMKVEYVPAECADDSSDNVQCEEDSGDNTLSNDVEYAILYNNQMRPFYVNGANTVTFEQFIALQQESEEQTRDVTNGGDVEEISGRNLLTGQKVSLNKYLDKVSRRPTSLDVVRSVRTVVDPLNKRIVGKTSQGKKLFGRILHVSVNGKSLKRNGASLLRKPRILRKTKTALDVTEVNLYKSADLRLYVCSVCGREFNKQAHLQRHAENHGGTSQTVYKCHICGSCYSYASSLTRHIVHNHLHPKFI